MGIFKLGRYNGLTAVLLMFLLGTGAILAINYVFASGVAQSLFAVRAISQQRLQPRVIAADTQILRGYLVARRYLGRELADLKTNVTALDAAFAEIEHLDQRNHQRAAFDGNGWPFSFAPLAGERNQQTLQELRQQWADYRRRLQPITDFNAEPYVETADRGTQLSAAGLRLGSELEEATRFGLARHDQIGKLIGALTAGVEHETETRAAELRIWLIGGFGSAGILLLAIAFYLRSVSRQEFLTARGKKEADAILRTVNQGLFLLDTDLKIGSERSEALERIFSRQDFDQLTFESLLRGIISDKTLDTAIEYVKLLWGERVNEKLIKTINPLSEVEVRIDSTGKGAETQFLEFDFSRVLAEGKMSRVLVTVNDVTRRAHLAQELQESQEKAQAQLDLLLHILHVEPRQLTGFLEESEVSMKMVNSVLKEPAREETAFRAKLDRIFRQIHSVKGEAAALGLKTVEQRAHSFEEALAELRGRPALSGSDFLPLVVKLADLFGHLTQVREMIGRLSDLRAAVSGDPAATLPERDAAGDTGPEGTLVQPASELLARMRKERDGHGLEATLAALAQRIAGEQSKQVAVDCSGFDRVPDDYARAIKDIAIQMVRNSLAHGIETPEERARGNKNAAGNIVLRFEDHGAGGCEFVCQDDGRGLSVQQLKETAVARGLITPEKAATLDDRRALSLIFVAGFSTQNDVSKDAGRGVGMDIVRNLVQELGGKLGISTTPGKFLRFRIWLPAASKARAA
jgi:two-component system chemotaxis sensor kinase CheA